MSLTGGPLNELNGKAGISAPFRSVPVMKLIKAHRPQSRAELEQLIADHCSGDCACGVKSQGKVADFGRMLYDAQFEYWGEERFDLQTCIQWEYDLFITQTLKGGQKEKEARQFLQEKFPDLSIEEARGYLDEELRIDLVISKEGKRRAGVQVKPFSFTKMRDSIIWYNRQANAKWGKPVWYMYYTDRGNWWKAEELINRLREHCG